MQLKGLLRKSSVYAACVLAGACVLIVLRGPQGLPALIEKRRLVQELQEANATLAAENQQKRDRIEKLKHSKAEQELEIRERLKYTQPGETQLILPEEPASK